MYKKILVPLDGSPFAECVLEHIKNMAVGKQISEVVLVFVVEPINQGVYDMPENTLADIQKQSESASEDYLKKTASKLAAEGIPAVWTILHGGIAEAILEYAGKNKIDLVIMSTHGLSGVSRWAMGSVAYRVARQVTVPIMLVAPPDCRIA
jgi:nucleotide-binding universal stress UspA family protein